MASGLKAHGPSVDTEMVSSPSRARYLVGVLILLMACWLPSALAGGETNLPPLALALPGIYAALRLGAGAALAAAVTAGVVAGPLTPAAIDPFEAQSAGEWLFRTAFFVIIALGAHRYARRLQRETDRHHAQARTDPLTGMANRTMLDERLATAVRRADRSGHAVALAYLDLDDFKVVNDTLGHAAGDELLTAVAERLRGCARAADLVARQGGDEFLFLLNDLTPGHSAPVAQALFDRVQIALDAPFAIAGAELLIGASMGVSVFPDDAPTAGALRQHADTAMYRAKESGSTWAPYEASATAPTARLTLAARLRRAVRDDELVLHYQPVVRLTDGCIMGVEALVRWRREDGTLVNPGDFIGVAEQTGVIDAVGDWVLEELCRQARVWGDAGLHPKCGINVSPRQLRRAAFAERFAGRIRDHGLDPQRFVVELTESAWTLDAERTLPVLHALRATGVLLALDDFGAGYSSLSRLLELPVDVIKVDRSLLAGVPERVAAVAVFEAIRGLAKACGCDVVAEGVETAEQLVLLERLGCQLGQGYGIARPADATVTTERLRAGLEPGRRQAPAAALR